MTTSRHAASRAQPRRFVARLQWVGYGALIAILLCVYVTMLTWGQGIGVDYSVYRAASIVQAQGGNPYDTAQIWHMEDLLYNLPGHLNPGDRGYFTIGQLSRYPSPPIFASVLWPLARLPFAPGLAAYAALVVVLAFFGSWLTLRSFDWTRRLPEAIGISLVIPFVFLTVWYGQQSTILLCALGGALFALRRERPGLAGALLAVGWIKPQLLLPVALLAPLMFSRRAAVRWYLGFGFATAIGVIATVMSSGAASIAAWLHDLIDFAGHVDSVPNYLPSLSGMSWILLPHPWNRLAVVLLMLGGLGAMLVLIVVARRHAIRPETGVAVLIAVWLLFTPYFHAHDEVLLLPALAVAWGRNGARGAQLLPSLALWAVSALSLAFVLPEPWKLLGIVPPVMVLAAALTALRDETALADRALARGPAGAADNVHLAPSTLSA